MTDKKPALNLVKKLQEELKRNLFLREELRREFKLREAAEESRDIIRAHAQAALVKYRAQDDLLEELDKLLRVRQANPRPFGSPWQQGFTLALELLAEKRAAVKAT